MTKLQWLWSNMRGTRALFVLSMFGTIVYNIMQLTVPYFSSRIVDTFLTGEDAANNLANHRDLFFRLIILMIVVTVARVIIVYGDCMAYEFVSQKTLYRIRNFLYDKIQRQDMKFYSKYRTGDLMTRMTGDLDAVRHMIAWVTRMIIESFSLYLATAVYLFIMNWRLALSVMILSPVILAIIVKFRGEVAPKHRELREKLANMNTYAQENISGNRVVKAFAREDYEIDKFDSANADFRDTNKSTQRTWIKYYPYIESCANLLAVILLAVGGIFLIRKELSMGEYVAFSGLIWAIANPMRQLGGIMNEFQRFSAASAKVMEIYYSEPEIVDGENAVDHPGPFEGKIEFKHVSFMYSDGKLPVLRDVSFTANPGETVAIMGETGCGKTSLIHLIPRFYEPTEGEVLIDGVNVKDYKLHELRKNIGLATQDVLLYSDTIEGNIAYGVTHLTPERVVKFARYASVSDFISKMPEGYDTIVGERGVGLSGGQKQRISLARALAIEPSILILDDTTSAVDMETEKEIQHSLRNLDFNCTKIIIAQRISTTKFADKILVLQDGRITEEGTHEELIAKGGYYSELVKLQTGGDE
ncbi:MAG: ABC transporter ATP-binding protein/permease [Lachnospiraceae bacterium]|nr:ABC transporter ATP-binding protein/permease [Lachnospiraceae bacterium]